MKPVSESVFNKFFNSPPPENYRWYVAYSLQYRIKEHLHFLAQIAHESNFLKHKKESHFYSFKRIKEVFPRYFKNVSDRVIKARYEKKPALLDRVYANRMGNGDEASQDGSKYRGRGYIQLTGKNNYKKFGFIKRPEQLTTIPLCWKVCYWFWTENKLDDLCDENFTDLSYKEIKKITRKINGGYNGFNDRLQKSKLIEKYFRLKHSL